MKGGASAVSTEHAKPSVVFMPDMGFLLKRWLREIDEDIQRAEEQAGYVLDRDTSDGEPDDEDLSDSRGGLK